MNNAAITMNLLFALAISALSIHPTIQSYNPRAGLCQSAMVAVYCTYLTMSAVGMEPENGCNPLALAGGTRTASIVLGAIVTFLTMAWTTTRAATYGLALGSKGNSYSTVPSSEDDYEHGLVTQQPSSRREMRAAAIRAAVEVRLPARLRPRRLRLGRRRSRRGPGLEALPRRRARVDAVQLLALPRHLLALDRLGCDAAHHERASQARRGVRACGPHVLGQLGQDCVGVGVLCDLRVESGGAGRCCRIGSIIERDWSAGLDLVGKAQKSTVALVVRGLG